MAVSGENCQKTTVRFAGSFFPAQPAPKKTQNRERVRRRLRRELRRPPCETLPSKRLSHPSLGPFESSFGLRAGDAGAAHHDRHLERAACAL